MMSYNKKMKNNILEINHINMKMKMMKITFNLLNLFISKISMKILIINNTDKPSTIQTKIQIYSYQKIFKMIIMIMMISLLDER